MNRRSMLGCVSSVVIASVAGCFGDSDSTDETVTATDAVEAYFQALADSDRDRANQFAHPDGDYYIDDDHPFLSAQNLSITETEAVDIETAVRSMYDEPDEVQLDEVIEEERAAIEDVQDTHGLGEYEYVRHDATSDELTFNSVYLLFEDDRWVIWSVPTFHRAQLNTLGTMQTRLQGERSKRQCCPFHTD